MNATPHAIATATSHAMSPTSVHAKRREEKGRDKTTPDHTGISTSVETYKSKRRLRNARRGSSMRTREDRFWSKVTVTPSCWIWEASKTQSGYGQFWDGQTMVRAHLFALGLYGIEVPDDREADHLCRTRHCVNPSHLEVVTHAENMRRCRKYDLDSPASPRQRQAAYRERQKAKRESDRLATGWWVCI